MFWVKIEFNNNNNINNNNNNNISIYIALLQGKPRIRALHKHSLKLSIKTVGFTYRVTIYNLSKPGDCVLNIPFSVLITKRQSYIDVDFSQFMETHSNISS